MDAYIISQRIAEIDSLKSEIVKEAYKMNNLRGEELASEICLFNMNNKILAELYKQLFDMFNVETKEFSSFINSILEKSRKPHRS